MTLPVCWQENEVDVAETPMLLGTSIHHLCALGVSASDEGRVHAYVLRRARKTMTGASPFVGRGQELALLQAALREAIDGCGNLVLLTGESGVGKTRMASEFAAGARAGGATVLWGRCWEAGGAPPFWPWIQVVRAYLEQHAPEVARADLGRSVFDIARIVPEVATVTGQAEAISTGQSLAITPEHERFRIFDALTSFLKVASRRQPIVLILDDLQWADEPTLLLLEFLVREVGNCALLTLAMYRDGDATTSGALQNTLGGLIRDPRCQRMVLGGLMITDIALYVQGTLGRRPSATLVTALAERTEGNPFFLREVVQWLAAEGLLDETNSAAWDVVLPTGVRQAITRRLAPLPPTCRHLLGLASVIGREFDLDVLHVLASHHDVGDHPSPIESMLAALQPARSAGLIQEVSASGRRWTFAHTLIRETIYSEITTTRRHTLHGRIAHVLETFYANDLEAHLSELAYHFVASGPGPGDQARAFLYARWAGDRALQHCAYEEAVRWYQRARALHAAQLAWNDQIRCELLLALGEAQMRAGDTVGARERALEAAEVARRLGLREHFARAALGFGWWFRIGVVDAECIALLTEALGQLEDGDSPLKSRLLARLAAALYWLPGSHQRRDEVSAEAVAMARRLPDPEALAFALNARLYALWVPGDAELRLNVSRELLRLAESADDRELALQSRHWVVTDLLELGQIESAEREIAAHARLAEELRQPLYLWFASVWRAMRALLQGRFDHAESLAATALEIGLRAEPENAEPVYSALMFWLRREQGRMEEMVEAIRAYAAQHPDLARTFGCALALMYAELERKTDAEREFQALVTFGFANLQRVEAVNWQMALAAAAEACGYLDDPHAVDLYPLLLPFARRNILAGMANVCFGSGSRYLGLLATTLRRWPEAEQHFDDALAMHAELRSPPLIARTQHDYARMLIARDAPTDRARALALLDSAVATARALGMRALVEKSLALQAAVATDTPPRVVDPAPVGGCQFRRDGDYWTVSFDSTTCRLKDSKGLRYLGQLLWHPGREFHATELIGAARNHADSTRHHREGRHNERIVAHLGDAGPLLDRHATQQYQQRLAELREELAEAEAINDLGRTPIVRDEIAALTSQLASAARGRRANSHAERARMTVTKGIKSAIDKISAADPSLGRHLSATVRTGYFCSYTPDPRHPICWQE